MIRLTWLLSILVSLYSSSALAEKNVQLMASVSPPYADQKLPEEGMALQLVAHVFAGTDYQPHISVERWSRALEGASLGVYDGLASVWYSDERAKTLEFSEPYLTSQLVLLKPSSNTTEYHSLQDIAGSKVGVLRDYAYGVDFAAVPNVELVEENHIIQNLLNLLDGSIDFVIGDRRALMHQVNEFLLDRKSGLAVTGVTLPTVQRHIAVGRDLDGHEELVKQFNASLAKSRKDGSLDKIINEWDTALGTLQN
jgi:polar amino acid transport system substrate-binding protein